MLWEPVDPAAALTERFGFTDAGSAAAWLADLVRERWDLVVAGCDRLVLSASKLLAWIRIGGEHLVATCTADPNLFSRLAEIDGLIAWLDSEGVPVAAPLPTTDGGLRAEREGFALTLAPNVEGGPLDAEDEQQLVVAGRTLGGLHLALAGYPLRLSSVTGEGQLVHGDFRSANLLQRDGVITAVLDFDEVGYRSRAWEVGRSSGLLGTRYQDWRPVSRGGRAAFLAAYQEVAPLTDDELRSVDRVLAAVLQHFGWS